MSKDRRISTAVISRLPRYYRLLKELLDQGVDKISSADLSQILKSTSSQIRQDLNYFGEFGLQGYGYDVKDLYHETGRILGVEETHNIIVLGAGNLARALVKYKDFSQHGFQFCSLFDIDNSLSGKSINGVRIRSLEELDHYLPNNSIEIAVLTIPAKEAKNNFKRII